MLNLFIKSWIERLSDLQELLFSISDDIELLYANADLLNSTVSIAFKVWEMDESWLEIMQMQHSGFMYGLLRHRDRKDDIPEVVESATYDVASIKEIIKRELGIEEENNG